MGSAGGISCPEAVLEVSPIEVSTSNTTPVGSVRCFFGWLMGSAGSLSCPGVALEFSPVESICLWIHMYYRVSWLKVQYWRFIWLRVLNRRFSGRGVNVNGFLRSSGSAGGFSDRRGSVEGFFSRCRSDGRCLADGIMAKVTPVDG